MKPLANLTALMIVIVLSLIFAKPENEWAVLLYLSMFFVSVMWIATVIELIMDKINER